MTKTNLQRNMDFQWMNSDDGARRAANNLRRAVRKKVLSLLKRQGKNVGRKRIEPLSKISK